MQVFTDKQSPNAAAARGQNLERSDRRVGHT